MYQKDYSDTKMLHIAKNRADQLEIASDIKVGPLLRYRKANNHDVLRWHYVDALAQNSRRVQRISRHASADSASGGDGRAFIRPESRAVV